MLPADEPNARPADVLIENYIRNQSAVIDCVIYNPNQQRFNTRLNADSIENAAGVVASAAHDAKDKSSHALQSREQQHAYYPFAEDLFGHCTRSARPNR